MIYLVEAIDDDGQPDNLDWSTLASALMDQQYCEYSLGWPARIVEIPDVELLKKQGVER